MEFLLNKIKLCWHSKSWEKMNIQNILHANAKLLSTILFSVRKKNIYITFKINKDQQWQEISVHNRMYCYQEMTIFGTPTSWLVDWPQQPVWMYMPRHTGPPLGRLPLSGGARRWSDRCGGRRCQSVSCAAEQDTASPHHPYIESSVSPSSLASSPG